MTATGEIDGLGWYEMPRGIFQYTQGFQGDQSAPVVTILTPLGYDPGPVVTSPSANASGHLAYRYVHTLGMRLVGPDALPGRLIAYDKYAFDRHDFLPWIAERVEIPENVDFRIEVEVHHSRTTAIARTMRKGVLVDVRRKLDPSRPILDQLPKILTYFRRNCPRIEGEASALSCGAHLSVLLAGMDAAGIAAVGQWTGGSMFEDLKIAGASLPGTQIETLRLRKAGHSNAIHMTATLSGGHKVEDDPNGTTITLAATLSATVLNGIKGETVDRIVDVAWLSGFTIRTAASGETGGVRLRAFGDNGPFVLPKPPATTTEATLTLLDGLVGRRNGQHGDWMGIDDTVAAILEPLPVAVIGAILARLAVETSLDLGEHGLPGWRLERNGNTISARDVPSEKLSIWLDRIRKRLVETGT